MTIKARESVAFQQMNAELIFQKSMAWVLELEAADVVVKYTRRNPSFIVCIIMIDVECDGKTFAKYFELRLNIMVDNVIISMREIESGPRNRRLSRAIRHKFRDLASQYKEYISPRRC